jgi:amidohydrolase
MHPYLKEAQSLFEYTQTLRRDFHRHPELGFQEVRTAGIVARELNALGLEVSTGIAKTGVVALLEGARPGPVVLLRFDMDALPVQEETGAEYASQIPGVMHACGHDGHTAVGLTVARLLHAHRQELVGTVKLVFQPAEEGIGGAQGMVAEGVLENPRPQAALALHVWNEKPLGWMGTSPGPMMAASDEFCIQVTGRGGHGGLPHQTIDPVLASAHIITALQSIVSRNVAPLQSAVVSVTMVHGGEAMNIIPTRVELKGTIRTFEPAVREAVLKRFHEIILGTAQTLNCQAEIQARSVTPAVVNDPRLTQAVLETAAQVLPECQPDASFKTMVSEDMAYMMQAVPGCYFFLGSANPEKGLAAAHHHPRFDFDEQVLPRAAALMTAAAANLLAD